jgi:arylsulfatase A-like enzyme
LLLIAALVATAMRVARQDVRAGFGCNLLLITLDTARADYLGPYGGQEASTPALDALAASGTLFTRAATPVPTTLSSHIVMLSGLMPRDQGVPRNGFALSDSVPLLSEMLQEQGYQTVAFISSFALDTRFGLDRGFADYDCDYDVNEEGWSLQRRGRETARQAASTLLKLPEPFFLWVHLFDPHYPYEPEPAFDQVPSDHPASGIYQGRSTVFEMRRSRRHPHWDELIDYLRGKYAGEIAATDAQVARILAGLDASGRGESTIHVPLIIRCPWRRFASRVTAPVSTVDLLPTIAELLALPIPEHAWGQSLVPLLAGQDGLAGEDGDTATLLANRPLFLNATKPFRLEEGLPPERLNERKARGVMLGTWKYVFYPEDGRELLFDLASDPLEQDNLSEKNLEFAARLRSMMTQYWASTPDSEREAAELVDEETIRKLRSLGYLK